MQSRLLMLLLAAGCGATSPGTGSKTLQVVARLEIDTNEGTAAAVSVHEHSPTGALVRDAVVSVFGPQAGTVVLPFNGESGDYRLEGFEWDESFALLVVRGADTLDGAIDAPGSTTIIEPAAGATFSKRDGALVVAWKDSRGQRATRARLTFDKAGFVSDLTADPFRVSVDPAQLKVSEERIDVARFNEISLVGGTPGSILSATSSARVELSVTE